MTNSADAMDATRERPAWSISGYPILLLFVALLALVIWRTTLFATDPQSAPLTTLDMGPAGFAVATAVRVRCWSELPPGST